MQKEKDRPWWDIVGPVELCTVAITALFAIARDQYGETKVPSVEPYITAVIISIALLIGILRRNAGSSASRRYPGSALFDLTLKDAPRELEVPLSPENFRIGVIFAEDVKDHLDSLLGDLNYDTVKLADLSAESKIEKSQAVAINVTGARDSDSSRQSLRHYTEDKDALVLVWSDDWFTKELRWIPSQIKSWKNERPQRISVGIRYGVPSYLEAPDGLEWVNWLNFPLQSQQAVKGKGTVNLLLSLLLQSLATSASLFRLRASIRRWFVALAIALTGLFWLWLARGELMHNASEISSDAVRRFQRLGSEGLTYKDAFESFEEALEDQLETWSDSSSVSVRLWSLTQDGECICEVNPKASDPLCFEYADSVAACAHKLVAVAYWDKRGSSTVKATSFAGDTISSESCRYVKTAVKEQIICFPIGFNPIQRDAGPPMGIGCIESDNHESALANWLTQSQIALLAQPAVLLPWDEAKQKAPQLQGRGQGLLDGECRPRRSNPTTPYE